MLSVEKCKELLGEENLSDEQVEAIRADLYELAELAFSAWQYEKQGSKYPVGLLPDSVENL